MLNKFRSLNKNLYRLYILIAMISLGGLTISSSVQVFSRYVLNNSQGWTDEASRYLFIWFNFMGAAIIMRNGGHAAVDFISKRLKGYIRIINEIIIYSSILIISFIFIYYGFELVMNSSMQKSPAMGLPVSVMYLPLPIGGFGIAINVIEKMIDLILMAKGNRFF